ncbi:MAG: Gfo/Idh/MocA family oxidoreductase [candidate division Zixibacteria bacterium]|nr:Gfo/Idh/MocA family oxidoreductase [candidate division Zixibacteria bacterium]
MGVFHAAKLAKTNDVDFIGCYDAVSEKAEKTASKYNCASYKSIAEIADDVEAVLIAVPTQNHLECSLPFLEKGIAVLVEKPIASDIGSAEKIVKTANENNAVLQVGHSERFSSVYRAVRERILNPRFVETHRLAPFKARGHDVAVILDLMIHDIDLLLDLTGEEPAMIEAVGVPVITDTFDIVNARLTFPSGCVANITSSRISVKEMRKLRVFQESGYISMDMASAKLESFSLVNSDSPMAKKAGLFSRMKLPDGRLIVKDNIKVKQADNLQSEIDSFIGAIKGEHPPLVSGEDGLSALKVAKRIEELCMSYQSSL